MKKTLIAITGSFSTASLVREMMLKRDFIIVLANTTETPDVADILALDNALTLDSDGYALLAPFGEHKKERIANINGTLVHEKYIQIVDQQSVDAVLANEKGTNIFAKLKHALVKRPIYRDHPDLKLYAPETVQSQTSNNRMSPLGVNDACRKSDRGLEFRPLLSPEGATAVSEDGCKYPSAVFMLKKTGIVRDGGWIEVRPFALASIGLTANPNISGVDSLANAKDAAKQTDENKQPKTSDTIMKQLLIGWLAAQGVTLANDAADQAVFDAFNKEMLTRTTSITALGNDKQTLTGTVNTLTGDKTKLVTGAALPTDLVTAANTIIALENAKTDSTKLRRQFFEARVDLNITQGKTPVADRTKEIDALLALGNDKVDTALTALDARPVKFAVASQVDAKRKNAAGAPTTVAQAREEILTLANSDDKYRKLEMGEAMKLIEKDRPDLFEVLRAKPSEEKTTAATT
ncbi:MAG TPA: phage protease [Verrucomicrobiae bacterium]|jgi:hypothetical protein|nr:phage protease [Verrucomicrobiae bacterium]